MTIQYKKTLLASAIVMSLTGFNVYAANGSHVTESQMFNVNRGEMESMLTETEPVSVTVSESIDMSMESFTEETNSGIMDRSIQGMTNSSSVGDASMYLAPSDNEEIAKAVGQKLTSIDFSGVPEEVKAQLLPLVTEKIGDSISMESIHKDIAALGGTGVFSQISPMFKAVPEGMDLTFVMVSNPIIHKVDFEGNTVFSNAELESIMQIPSDSVLNFALVSQHVKEIENLYLQQGYILVSINDITVTEDGTLRVKIAEGNVEDIQLIGNEKTKDKVILRELRLKKGKPFNKYLASRSIERLYNLGFFEDVNMRLLPSDVNDHNVIVEIDVIEQKTGVVTVGAGYSHSDGMVGILELGENNFRGTGDKVNLHWEFGGSSKGKNYELSYTHPYINDNGDSLGVSVFDRRYSYDDYDSDGHTIAEYDKRKKGFNISWGHVSGEYRTHRFDFQTVRESYDNRNGFKPGSVMLKYLKDNNIADYTQSDWYKKIMENFGRTNSFTYTHVFDNRDNYYNATKGRRLSFSAEVGGHGLGGNYDYYKFTAEGRFYRALSNGHVLALRVMAGYVNGNISYNNLFDLGGSDSLRGYEDDQFKGRKMYEATLEYRVPVSKKVEAVLFTDVGSAWDIQEGKMPWYKDDNSIHASVGVGLRLQTPIGPVRLDYGHGDRNKFHFSFGAQF